MRDSFVFYRSFADAIAGLPPEEYKKVMQAIIGYALDGTEPTTGGIDYTVFCLVKPQIDANNKRYENGKKGGRPITKQKPSDNQDITKEKPNSNQDITNEEPCDNQDITNSQPNVYVNVNDNDIKKKDTNVSKEKAGRFKPPTVTEVENYCREKEYRIDCEQFVDFYQSKNWMVGKNKMKDWRASVRNWARGNRLELTAKPAQGTKFNNFTGRGYDMYDLEKQFVEK